MKLTVEDVMKLEPLTDGKVIAGHHGLCNVVTSVSVLEIPKATIFLKKGEIEISAFYSIVDSVDAQLDVIHALKKCNSSGLILCHVGLILSSISQSLIDLCNKLDFPLILAPSHIAYIDIISPILDSLLQTQNQKLAHAMRIYDKMTNLMLEEKDFDDIIMALSKLINRTVFFFNFNNTCISSSHDCLSPKYDIYLKQNIKDRLNSFFDDNKDIYINSIDNASKILLAPVVSSMMYYGVVVILDASDLSDLDYISLIQTKNALGIITLNKINLKDYNLLLKHDYINDLVMWNFSDEQTALQRGLALGYDISRIKIIMIVDIFNFSEFSVQYSENQLQKIKLDFYNTVQHELSYSAPESIMINFSDKVLILFSSDKGETLTHQRILKISEQIRQAVAYAHNLPVSIGIGRYYDNISDIKISYQEALSAIRISNRIFKEPKCTFFEEVQVYSLISDSLDILKAKAVVNNLLLPIKQYDDENNTQLLLTFKMLILCNMDTIEVSEKIFLHKNTVLQRKKKISKLFKYDPFSMPYRLQFQIVIMIDSLLALNPN